MSNITVWTKQHENVLKELETVGRYIAKQEYIRMDLKNRLRSCWKLMTGW